MKDVAFVIRLAKLATAIMRGQQIGAALGAGVLRLRELTLEQARAYRVLVYVKHMPPPVLMQQIRDAGVLQVADPIDNYRWRELRRAAPLLDHFIAASHTHRMILRHRYGVPATVIPHHHCNTDELRIEPGREPPTLGYIGGRDHWGASRRLVRGLRYPVFSFVETPGPLLESYLRVDVGFAWRHDPEKISYNAATKLTNYMSFGIPSVLNPESGYLEVSRHAEACLYAQSKQEFTLLLQELANDPVLRRRLGEAGYEGARRFHLRHIALQYRALLESL